MTEAIGNFFSTIFKDNVMLATILIAILPMIELKGAIPFAMSQKFWGAHALGALQAFGYSFLGSILVVPLLALVFKPIYNFLITKKGFRKILEFFVGNIEQKRNSIDGQTAQKPMKYKTPIKILSVIAFVAFPVPLTGVWTGTCLAVLLGLDFWQTCISVIFGNFICGIIVAFICTIFPNATTIILYIFLLVIAAAMLAKIIVHFCKAKKEKANKNGEKLC